MRTRGSDEPSGGRELNAIFRSGRTAASTGATPPAHCGADGSLASYTARWRQLSTAAIGCRPISTAMSSSPNLPAISSAASLSPTTGPAPGA